MRLQVDLNEEELRWFGQQIVGIADALDTDEDEIEGVTLQITTAAMLGERVLEWVAAAKQRMARQGIAA
jgi:hypothetical protein